MAESEVATENAMVVMVIVIGTILLVATSSPAGALVATGTALEISGADD